MPVTLLAALLNVTAAMTPKGERRRYALISAAAELLREGGFEAVRHRAVARRAGLPLASTTYYFSSLDDLVLKAVEYICAVETAQLRARVDALPRRRRGVEATADVLVEMLVGDPDGEASSEELISRYERYIACARHPELREIQHRLARQRVDAVAEAVARSRRTLRIDLVRALIHAVDGAVVSALVSDGDGPREVARATVMDVIELLAPIDERTVRV